METPVDDGADRTIRVLLVDDQPDLAEVTGLHLENRRDSFEVVLAPDGPTALDRLEATAVDCVVSDYEMPGMDGLELLRAVTEREPSLPFILYTGKGSEEIASEAISAGVTDYLQKRTTSEQYDVLANRIENAVARRRSERAREESEGRYRTLVDASPHAILVHYGETIVYVNDTMVRMFGFEAQSQAHGTAAMSYVHPDDRDAVRERMRLVLDDREESDWIAWRLLRDDGEIREVESRGTPVVYDGQRAVQVVVRDLTDQRRRERQLGALNGALDDLAAADARTAVGETAVDAVVTLLEAPTVGVFEAVEGALLELAVAGADGVGFPPDARGLPDDSVEMAAYRAGTPRLVDSYAAREDRLVDGVASVFLFPLDDDGLLWVGSREGFASADRDALEILGRAVVAAFDRLDD
ncbi:response regulator [Haloarcula onubensis]|uniref:Response regulator n=1 Tax=Haloarcula onubensis TaxID=2950539 RepID=A0ABU2FPX1_9EURY|nr:response regulator [Halomicroarcula sp. S3CR25-11]MDS0282809.1 response regulator [Halomicroarcula sp. S3CR25-11]